MQDLRPDPYLLNLTLFFDKICCFRAGVHKAQVRVTGVFLSKCLIVIRGKVDLDLHAFSISILYVFWGRDGGKYKDSWML